MMLNAIIYIDCLLTCHKKLLVFKVLKLIIVCSLAPVEDLSLGSL